MKHQVKHTLLTISLLSAVMLVLSCSDSDNEQADDSLQTINMTFKLVMGSNSDGSRANTWGDGDYTMTNATVWENTIEPGKLRVLVYSMQDGSKDICLGEVADLAFHRIDNTTDQNIYDVTGSFTVKVSDTYLDTNGNLPCKLVVLANYDNNTATYTQGTDISAIKDITFRYNASGIAAQTSYIPMWGVHTYIDDDALVLGGGRHDVGTIYLLRAMSKLKVQLSDEVSANYTLSDVSLSNYAYRGYIVPAGYDVANTEDLLHTPEVENVDNGSFHPYTDGISQLSINFIAEASGRSYVAYIPEFNTTLDAASGKTDPTISLTLTPTNLAKSPLIYNVPLTNNDGTAAQPFMRNTVYNYSIVGTDLAIEYQALDWNDKGGDVTFK